MISAPGGSPPQTKYSAAGGRAGLDPQGDGLGSFLDACRTWLGEFFPNHHPEGSVKIALQDSDGWQELAGGGFRRDAGTWAGRAVPQSDFLDSLAEALIAASATANVFVSPYLHAYAYPRTFGGAVERRHVHADIDGPIDLDRVGALGGFAVASGSVDDAGTPHGHIYVRLSESVDAETHKALCSAFGAFIGGDDHDTSKVSDVDVLRPAGTLNRKTEPPRRVSWLIGPNEATVKTWTPEELAERLGVESVDAAVDDIQDLDREAAQDRGEPLPLDLSERRIDGLIRAVENAAAGEGNRTLNWSAGIAGALWAVAGGDLDESSIRDDLLAAFLARPIPERESASSRKREGLDTIASGWKWGSESPSEALGEAPTSTVAPIAQIAEREKTYMASTAEDTERTEASEGGGTTTPPPPSSWLPQDLTAALDPARPPILPTVGADHLGEALLYPGRIHTVASATEGGKTWLAIGACAVPEMRAGNGVLFIDAEDSAEGAVDRLLALGVDRELIADRFHYVSPDAAMSNDDRLALLDWIAAEGSISLCVVDGVTDALALFDLDGSGNADVAKFVRAVVRPIADTGAAVLLLDHVTKASSGSPGRYAIGAVHKLNGVSGAAFVLDPVQGSPIGPGREGRSLVKIAKDRPGRLRTRAAEGTDSDNMRTLGTLVIASAGIDPGDAVSVELRSGEADPSGSGFASIMEQARDVLDNLGVDPEAGQMVAWETVKRAREAGHALPPELTRKVIRQAQNERSLRTLQIVVDNTTSRSGRGDEK